MSKQTYIKPAMLVASIQQARIICGTVDGISNDEGLKYGGSDRGIGDARSRSGRGWDDWDEE